MNMVFSNRDEGVDYFLFSFDQESVTEEKLLVFKNLLASLLENYTFPMQTDRPFSQCGPARYNF